MRCSAAALCAATSATFSAFFSASCACTRAFPRDTRTHQLLDKRTWRQGQAFKTTHPCWLHVNSFQWSSESRRQLYKALNAWYDIIAVQVQPPPFVIPHATGGASQLPLPLYVDKLRRSNIVLGMVIRFISHLPIRHDSFSLLRLLLLSLHQRDRGLVLLLLQGASAVPRGGWCRNKRANKTDYHTSSPNKRKNNAASNRFAINWCV